MKTRTIKQIIRKKVDEWLLSISDENVRNLAAKGTIVTGGAISSMLLREKVNDFDLYFRNREVALAVAKHYVDQFLKISKPIVAGNVGELKIYVDESKDDRVSIVVKSAGVASEDSTEKPYEYFEARPADEAGAYVAEVMDDPEAIEDAAEDERERARSDEAADSKPRYRPIFLSTNAITLSQRVQLVLRFYGEAEKIHENYDFVHCTNYWKSWDDELVLRPAAMESLLTRELRYVGSRYPICSLIRLRKFIKRGFTVNAGQVLKMATQVAALDLKNPEVLKDQLTGVDVAYFGQVIHALAQKDPDKVDTAYLVEIIDRMF